MPSDLEVALLAWLRSPAVRLSVSSGDDIQALREEIERLSAELVKKEADRQRLEALYTSECLVNLRLEDELRKFRYGR